MIMNNHKTNNISNILNRMTYILNHRIHTLNHKIHILNHIIDNRIILHLLNVVISLRGLCGTYCQDLIM